MKILFTICARAGSKGVAGKNIRDFCGYPLLYTTLAAYDLFLRKYGAGIEAALAINTDSEILVNQMRTTKLTFSHVPRSPGLAGDTASKIEVIAETLLVMEQRTGVYFDLVVDIDLTSPLRKAEDIKNVIMALLNNPQADAAMTVTEPRRNAYFNQLSTNQYGFLSAVVPSNYVTRQQAPPVYDANASIYAYRPSYLKSNDGILLHGRVAPSMMTDTAILDIDSEEDFELMQLVAEHFYSNFLEFREVRDHVREII